MRGVYEPDGVWELDINDGEIHPFRGLRDLGWRRGLPTGETGHDTFLGI